MLRPLIRPLPDQLEALAEIALDLRWTWSHSADRLWQTLSPEIWQRTSNPWLILQSVSQRRLDEIARDGDFLGQLETLRRQRQQYLTRPTWYAEAGYPPNARIAYFSMEYGIADALPLYSGGLGVLAGDHMKTASDLGVPVIGVGLLYQVGYFRQMLDADGQQLEVYPYSPPSNLPITALRDSEGAWLSVPLELPGRTVRLRLWQAQVGRASLYLLDSNEPTNSPFDRGITSRLYTDGQEMRLVQEMALGIGGWRALEALGLTADVCHLNEGHAAMVTIERACSFAQAHHADFEEALWATRAGNVFTTHTPLAVAFDTYPAALVARYLRPCAERRGIAMDDLLRLGRADGEDGSALFNLAYLAAHTCSAINGVSRLHGQVSRRIFQALYPRWPEEEVPVTHITNGVHVPTWDSAAADRLWTESCGKARWLGTLDAHPQAMGCVEDSALWNLRVQERVLLIDFVRKHLARQFGQRGADRTLVERAMNVLDPNALTLGFARRFAAYKRPNLLLTDPERLVRLLTDPQRPVQLIVAGKAHPEDREGKVLVREWARFVSRPEVRAHAVFLEDYDVSLAQELVQGVDVWINTPRRPWEACGTSGMKVLVNGGLNLSELDGWWAEAYRPETGWALGDGREHDEPQWGTVEAQELYRLLEDQVVPQFYARDSDGIPRQWVARMRASMGELAPRFSSNRMVREYVENIYQPAVAAYRARAGRNAELARTITQWARRIDRHWGRIHVGATEASEADGYWHVRVPVYLGDLSPSEVRVEFYAGSDCDAGPVRVALDPGEALSGAVNGFMYYGIAAADRPLVHYTARVLPSHPDARLPAELPHILWQK